MSVSSSLTDKKQPQEPSNVKISKAMYMASEFRNLGSVSSFQDIFLKPRKNEIDWHQFHRKSLGAQVMDRELKWDPRICHLQGSDSSGPVT